MTSSTGPADLRELLAEREWVRRVARALASDAAGADDAEQDAWLAAMRSPPAAGSVRAWFRAVLRSRVVEGVRRTERRTRRETAAARPEREPSAAEIVARAEAHREVVEAVLALDEPWRTTVVLRYFEDLTPAAIGVRLGVPADTVRSRLRRAHDVLRQRLERREGGRRAAWAVLLGAPGAAGTNAAPLGGSMTATNTGGVTLATSTTKAAVAAGAVALAILGLVAWMGSGSDLPPGDVSGAQGTTAQGGPSARDGDPAHATRAAAPARGDGRTDGTLAAASGATLSGDVRFVAGDRPAADIDVEVRTAAGVRRLRTDTAGAWQAAGLETAAPLAVSAAAPGLAAARVAGVRLVPGESRRLDTLWLDAPVAIDAQVIAADGAPVEGANVEAYRVRPRVERQDWDALPPVPEETLPTDKEGHARFASLSVGTWSFRATHASFAPSGAGPVTLLRGGAGLDVVIRLERGNRLSGTVTGVDGNPLAGALVVALPPVEAQTLMTPRPLDPLRVETRTDDAGRYAFEAIAAGDHSIAVLLPGTLPARAGVVSIPSVTVFDITLDGATLRGRVTEEGTGRALEGARVRAAVWRRHSPTYLSAVSDAEGRWAVVAPLGGILQGPSRGEGESVARPVHFDVEKEGFVYAPDASATPWRNPWVFGGKDTVFDVVMRPAASLAGTVTGQDGPVAGAEVVADVWSPLRGSLPQRTTTDASGAYRFGGVAAGRARVVVTREGWFQPASPGGPWRTGPAPDPSAVVDVPAQGEVRHDVRLERGVALRGKVVEPSGAPVPAAEVRCDVAGDVPRRTTTSSEGEFEIAGLRPGAEAKLRAVRDGWRDAEATATAPRQSSEASPALRIVLERAGVVRGRVAGPDGGAVADAWVQVAPAKLALDTGYEVAGVWHAARRWPVATDGSFDAPIAWMAGAAADGVVVRAGAAGLAPALSARLSVPAGGVADAGTLRLEAGHRLEGRVVAADGSGPVAGAEIEFQNERLPPALSQRRDWSAVGRDSTPFEVVARTGADGRFAIDGLPPWRYELRVTVAGVPRAEATVAVPQDQPETFEVAPSGAIAGRVVWEDGSPAAEIAVLARPADSPAAVAGFTESAADGSFEVLFLPAGRYALEARRPSDRVIDVLPTTTAPVEGGTRDVRITVKRGGKRIAGRCQTTDGAAVPGAVIQLRPAGGGPPVIARAAPDGRFEAAGLADGGFTLTSAADRSVGPPSSFGRRLVTDAVSANAGDRDVRLEFRPAAPIAGRVVREDGGVPAGELLVQARRGGDAQATQGAPVGADGSFTLASTSAGAWTLSVLDRRTGAPLALSGAAEFQGGTNDARLVVASSAALSGRVLDERGRAVAGVRVVARGPAGKSAEAVTDGDGRFTWTSLGEGTWDVEAAAHETGRADVSGVAAGAPELVLTLRATEVVGARVVTSDGSPVRGAEVVLAADGRPAAARLRTDADGRFTSRALPPGEYAVTLAARDGRPVDPPVLLGRVRSGAAETVLRI